jgi:hypothetical protein
MDVGFLSIRFLPGSCNTFLSLQRHLHLLFLLYWMTPLMTSGTAWLARAGVQSRINKTNTNHQVCVTWEKKEKETMNSITKLSSVEPYRGRMPTEFLTLGLIIRQTRSWDSLVSFVIVLLSPIAHVALLWVCYFRRVGVIKTANSRGL